MGEKIQKFTGLGVNRVFSSLYSFIGRSFLISFQFIQCQASADDVKIEETCF